MLKHCSFSGRNSLSPAVFSVYDVVVATAGHHFYSSAQRAKFATEISCQAIGFDRLLQRHAVVLVSSDHSFLTVWQVAKRACLSHARELGKLNFVFEVSALSVQAFAEFSTV